MIARHSLAVGRVALAVMASMCVLEGGGGHLVTVDIPYQKFKLSNGLTLIVHEDHKAPIVTVNVWYHVGSKNERPGRTGFAHLFEHLMFNGSEHYNADYFKLLEPEGATSMNGTTDFDRTNYFQDVPISALELVLWAESDRMGHLAGAIDQARLDEQRGVVLNEKRQGENQPYGKVYQRLFEGLFPAGHPYSWEVIGRTEDLEAATLKDVHQWFADYYGAANAVICLAGDLDPSTAKAKVEKYFGHIPSGPPVRRPEQWIPRRKGIQREVIQDRVNLPLLLLAWTTPGWGAPQADFLSLVGDILSSGKTSRLYKRLVYEEQLAVQVSASSYGLEIAGVFGVSVLGRPGADMQRIESIVNEEMDRFLRDGPTASELRRVQNQQVAGFVRGAERIGGFGGKSDILLENEVYGGDPARYRQTLERLQRATEKDLLEAARSWLGDGMLAIEVQPFANYATIESGIDRSRPPSTGEPPTARFPAFTRHELSNGLRVIVLENHAVPVLDFRLLMDAGFAADPVDLPGLASLTMDMLDEGTARRSTLEISEALVSLGARLSAGANLDQCVVSLNTLKSTLEPALDLFQDVLLQPAFPARELERLRKERLAAIEFEKTSPDSMALRVLPRLLYGAGHAYSAPLTGTGTEAAIQRIRTEDLRRFYGQWLKPNNATLLVVGDTTREEILPVLERVMGVWKAGEVPSRTLAAVDLPARSRVYWIDKPGAEQSVIFAAHLAPPRANPREEAIDLLNSILGGKFTSRINMNLRENKHWTYGARSRLVDARGQRPFFIQVPVQTDKTLESMEEIRRELESIRTDRPPTEQELSDTRRREVLALAGRWETIGAQAAELAEIVQFRLPDDHPSTFARRIRAVTDTQVAEVARDVLRPEQLLWVVVGDRAKAADRIEQMGYGPARIIDTDGQPVP